MSYLEAIKLALLFFPLLAFLFTIPFILSQYHRYGSINKFRVLIIYSFILYIITVYFLAIFPLPDKDSIVMNSNAYQLIPFNFIFDILSRNYDGVFEFFVSPAVYTVLFNLIMFMPLGIYLRYYFEKDLKHVFTFSFLFSLFLELTQLTGLYFIYPYPYRIFDVDDLFINTMGGIIGYFIAGLFMGFLPSRDDIDLESMEEGRKISGLRRITRFLLDGFIWLVFYFILYLFFDIHGLVFSLLIYYVLIPSLNKGQTLGSKFLKMRFEFPDRLFFRLFFRLIFVILYYIVIPFGVGYLFLFLSKWFKFSDFVTFIFVFVYVILLGVFYLFNIGKIFKREVLIYDRIFKLKYVSTIGEEKTTV